MILVISLIEKKLLEVLSDIKEDVKVAKNMIDEKKIGIKRKENIAVKLKL